MKRGTTGAAGPRGAKGARGRAGAIGRRGSIGKPGQRGLKGLSGTLYKAESLDRLVTNIEDIYQQLTALAKGIVVVQQQLDEIRSATPHNRR